MNRGILFIYLIFLSSCSHEEIAQKGSAARLNLVVDESIASLVEPLLQDYSMQEGAVIWSYYSDKDLDQVANLSNYKDIDLVVTSKRYVKDVERVFGKIDKSSVLGSVPMCLCSSTPGQLGGAFGVLSASQLPKFIDRTFKVLVVGAANTSWAVPQTDKFLLSISTKKDLIRVESTSSAQAVLALKGNAEAFGLMPLAACNGIEGLKAFSILSRAKVNPSDKTKADKTYNLSDEYNLLFVNTDVKDEQRIANIEGFLRFLESEKVIQKLELHGMTIPGK